MTIQAQSVEPFVMVLGIAQDGGYPHIGCEKECCNLAWKAGRKENVVSLAAVDPSTRKWWLLEATPDIAAQLHLFQELTNHEFNFLPEGVFLTHAHIGHYTGLMEFGKEAMNTKGIRVYALPRMSSFLASNGPWNQLVKLNNISVEKIESGSSVKLSPTVSIEAILVPHRDEYSETAGFKLNAGEKKYLFIPDIDKWEKWKRNIVDEVRQVDYAFLDATFFSVNELPGRNIREIPHPFVSETIALFKDDSDISKIYFIHLNHSNPLLWNAAVQNEFFKNGFRLAKQGLKF